MAWRWDQPSYTAQPDVQGRPTDYPMGSLYYIWHTDEPVTLPLSVIPDTYEVRNWRGEVITSGTCSASISLGLLPAGHYRMYFFKTGANDPDDGDTAGAINIAVWRRSPGIADRPTSENNPLYSETLPVVASMGATTVRFDISETDQTDDTLNDFILPGKAILDDAYLSYQDPARLDKEVVLHFSGGTEGDGDAAHVNTVVQALGTSGIWYECRNEPDTNTQPADFVPELARFYAMVKAVNPNARVLGPNQVSETLSSQGWTRRFFEAGGGDYIDGFSFHAYNVCSGELQQGRRNAEQLIALLEEFGQQNKPRWMTEWGQFAATYGSYTPLRQVRWLMTELLFWEQYGVPKERWYYFYNTSHGFWDFPSFIKTDKRGLLPAATAMRVFSEEVYGKSYQSRLNFGDEDNDFLGSRYSSVDGDMVALIACGRHGDPMQFSITNGPTSLEIIDAMGASTTIPVVDERVTITIPGTPVYVRLPHEASFAPIPKHFGPNLVRGGMWPVVSSSTGNGDALFLADQQIPPDYPYWGDEPLPITITLQLGQPTTFDTIYIRGTQPWQVRSAILEGYVEVLDGGTWSRIGTIHNTYTYLPFPTGWQDTNCFTETYYDERFSWYFTADHQIRGDQARLVVTKCTWGGEVAEQPADSGQGLGREGLSLQSIEVYNTHASGAAASSPSPAGPLVVVRRSN